jgi:hypothetical protein
MSRYGLELALDLNVWMNAYNVRLEV